MLSGNSLRNRGWILTARRQFYDLFEDMYVQQYRHWTSAGGWIDLDHEIKELNSVDEARRLHCGIFAKSIGTVLAVRALENRIVRPDWLLLCGLPYGYIMNSYPEFARILAATELPVAVIHNQHDPVGEAIDVKAYLADSFSGRQNYLFTATPGTTHDYEDFGLLRSQITTLKDANERRRSR